MDISPSEAVKIFVPANFKRPIPVFHSKAAATNPAALRKTNKRIVTNYSKDKVIALLNTHAYRKSVFLVLWQIIRSSIDG